MQIKAWVHVTWVGSLAQDKGMRWQKGVQGGRGACWIWSWGVLRTGPAQQVMSVNKHTTNTIYLHCCALCRSI